MSVKSNVFKLSNGIYIPTIGFGTSPLKDDVCYQAVLDALHAGYRHIDTAAVYLNEAAVGKAIRDSNIPREEIFVTSKLPAHIKNYNGTFDAFWQSLKALDLDYIDLYLIHAPWPWDDKEGDYSAGNVTAYLALEKLYESKRIRAIGVSNFGPKELNHILNNTTIDPHVNQIKYHLGFLQEETVKFCQERGILIEAYSPLGRSSILEHEVITKIAEKLQKTPAQICLRFILDQHIVPLPRSKTPERIIENSDLDFEIDDNDIIKLKAITL